MENTRLTPEERTVANLLLKGLSYRQIGSILGQSRKGIRHRTKRLYTRLAAIPETEQLDAYSIRLDDFLKGRFGAATHRDWQRDLPSTSAGSATTGSTPLVARGKIRINELARELEVKTNIIIEFLPEIGVADKKSHSSALDEEAADRVRRHFKNEEDDGPAAGSAGEYVGLTLVDGKFRLVAMLPDGSCRFLDSLSRLHELIYTVSSETRELERAIENLEDLLYSNVVKGKDFQRFFEANPDFITSDEHVEARADVYLTREGEETLKPDFVLKPFDLARTSDILELKLPTAPIFVGGSRRHRLSQAVMKARAQLLKYSHYFDDTSNREFIQGKYDIFAYRPRMFVVIGRRGTVNPIIRREAEITADDIRVMTYDDIMEKMHNKLKAMGTGRRRQMRSGSRP
jgi:hypothetical protein